MAGVSGGSKIAGSFARTISLIGESAFERLKSSSVLVVGLGGVGGAATEVLIRSGIGKLTLVDGDVFEPSNLNRQILCTADTLGMNKADAAKIRAKAINHDVIVNAVAEFFGADTGSKIFGEKFDYCIDAIDDLSAKTLLIVECQRRGVPIVSAMGAGNRRNCDFCVCDVYKTAGDPLARKLRKMLRTAGVEKLDVVCGTVPPDVRAPSPVSIAAPPFVMGAMLANHAIGRLIA